MIAPLIDHNKHQVLGTIQVYNRQQQSSRNSEGTSSLGFSNEDEIMFNQIAELTSSLLASLVNQQVTLFIIIILYIVLYFSNNINSKYLYLMFLYELRRCDWI